MLRQLTADRLARRGQGGFALMAGLAIWVGVCGISMVALLNMTMTSSRIATKQAEAATELRAVDSAMETAVAQVRMDPDAVIGASTGKGDGTCIQQLGASGLVGAPSLAEFDAEGAELACEYLQSVNSSAVDRARLCRLAYDVSVSAFAGRQQLYERYYTGDPVRLAGMLVNAYAGKADAEERVATLLRRLPDMLAPAGT